MENSNTKKKNVMIIVIIIIATFAIPLFIDWAIFGNNFPSHISNSEWAGFLGSFLGGIATMLSVFFTIRYSEKQRIKQEQIRENEKKAEKRTYLDIIEHGNASIDALKNYIPEKAKCIYLFKDQDRIADSTHCLMLQINNRSRNLIDSINIQLETTDQGGTTHTYESAIPYINSEELVFLVMPKATYTTSGGRTVRALLNPEEEENADEKVAVITIQYRTEAGEIIHLKITNGNQYTYTIQGETIFNYTSEKESRYLVPQH